MAETKYIQIRNAILHDIRVGKFPIGSKMPSRENLIKEYSVARATLNKALGNLISAGVLTATRKLGTFVSNADERTETALVCNLDQLNSQLDSEVIHDDIGRSIFNYILTHAPKYLHLSIIDGKNIRHLSELERYRKIVMLMPLEQELNIARKLYATEVCIINRSVDGFHCVSTNHHAATYNITNLFLDKFKDNCQIFFLDMINFSQIIRNERREGFIEACESHQVFYRIISGTGFDIVESLLKQKIVSGKKIVIVSSSRYFTGAVFKYSILRGLTFGEDIFYSDFDNFDAKIYFGVPMVSIVQDASALGQAAINFLKNTEKEKTTVYTSYHTIGTSLYFPNTE